MTDPREFSCMDDSPLNNGWGYNSPEVEDDIEEDEEIEEEKEEEWEKE